jgi:son of sevenless-like protein
VEGIIQNGTDDPWVKKLADDGVSFYYFNTLDGRVLWTAPDKPGVSTSSSSLPARHPDTSGLSVYSDDSDIQPFNDISARPRPQNGKSRHVEASSAKSEPKYKQALMELTASERIAKALQHTLEPSPPSPVTDLSAIAKCSIQAIIKNLQSNGGVRKPEDDKKMDQLVNSTVLAVRNLLYISAAPTSQIPNNLLSRSGNTRTSTPLKPAQRKVTATLSRLVLSARAMQYDSGSQLADTLNRIEADSEELEKAVLSFVLEAQRHQVNQSVPRRLQGVFTTANIGMGLVGAGAAGSWKGHGYVLLDDEAGMPQRTLGTEALTEINSSIDPLQTDFLALGQALRCTADSSGQ